TFNFAQASDDAVACGAASRIGGSHELAGCVQAILGNPEHRINMKEKAIAFSHTHQGATERTMALLEPLLKRSS
ncbi:MAG: 3-deoxy-D-manno-octulosonic-acid transferase, partial [Pseudomonadota bacterium]|nr:3-deoxy-D-manno-octulosonic-acid transferase [Pseudomonadota bacterium]